MSRLFRVFRALRTPRTTSGRGRRAQAMSEFALVAPLFFGAVFGCFQLGFWAFDYEILRAATRVGASAGAHDASAFSAALTVRPELSTPYYAAMDSITGVNSPFTNDIGNDRRDCTKARMSADAGATTIGDTTFGGETKPYRVWTGRGNWDWGCDQLHAKISSGKDKSGYVAAHDGSGGTYVSTDGDAVMRAPLRVARNETLSVLKSIWIPPWDWTSVGTDVSKTTISVCYMGPTPGDTDTAHFKCWYEMKSLISWPDGTAGVDGDWSCAASTSDACFNWLPGEETKPSNLIELAPAPTMIRVRISTFAKTMFGVVIDNQNPFGAGITLSANAAGLISRVIPSCPLPTDESDYWVGRCGGLY